MAKKDFKYGGWNYYTLQCITIMTLISPRDCTLPFSMWLWNHDSEFTKWQLSAMCYVALGWQSCHWICPVAAPCNVTRSSRIMTLNSPGGSTLQCGRWVSDDMAWNSPKSPPYWNSTSCLRFRPYHHSRHVALQNFIQIGPPSAEQKRRHDEFQDGGSQLSWILRVQ